MNNTLTKEQEAFAKAMRDSRIIAIGDTRYKQPKEFHKQTVEDIDGVISQTQIYSEAREELLNAQRKQVGYGMDKYVEPLTADSWSDLETLEHIIDEAADKLHYLIMMRIKMKRRLEIESGSKKFCLHCNTGLVKEWGKSRCEKCDTGEQLELFDTNKLEAGE